MRRCGSNAEEVGLAYDMLPERDAIGLVGTMKSSANSWSAVSSSIDVSADDDDRREPILSRDRMMKEIADPSQIYIPEGWCNGFYTTIEVMLTVT